MAALLNCFKQAWTSIVNAFTGCCGKSGEDPTTTTMEISTGVDGETTITTLDTLQISDGGGGSTHAELLGASLISSGGGGTTHDTNL
ncbi:hypothetical protein LXL04_035858 [Taraxacum kok-saghyz]